MAGVSLAVTRPSGRALVVGNPASRAELAETLQRLGYGCAEMDDPYAAMAELCRRPLVYRAVVLSLTSLHREELAIIPGVKRRFPHVDIWITHTDGRQAALADAMRYGADGLLSGEGLHRVAIAGMSTSPFPSHESSQLPHSDEPLPESAVQTPPAADAPGPASRSVPALDDASTAGEPVLSAEELRALLQEQPSPGGGNE